MNGGIDGGCLCGRVRFTVSGPFRAFHLCHCSRCRKATGSAHAANIFAPAECITWHGGTESLRRHDLADAERFSRCFCGDCGSALPCVSRDGRMLIIPAGSLDQDPGIRPQDQIFWRDRAPWYDTAAEVPRFDAYPE